MIVIEFETPTLNEKGKTIVRARHSAEQFSEELGSGIRLDMLVIPSGDLRRLLSFVVLVNNVCFQSRLNPDDKGKPAILRPGCHLPAAFRGEGQA
jgi:hypothetical protein